MLSEFFDPDDAPLPALNESDIGKGRTLISQGHTALDDPQWLIGPDRKRVQKPQDKDFKWSYASYYRPLMHVVAKNVISSTAFEIGDVEGTHWSIVYSKTSLHPTEIFQLELTPLYRAMGRFIYDFARAQSKPIELGKIRKNGDMTAAVVFRNPRRLWQVSYFDQGIGPTGHDEQSDKPWELAYAAWQQGYTRWSPGLVDNIMGTVEEAIKGIEGIPRCGPVCKVVTAVGVGLLASRLFKI